MLVFSLLTLSEIISVALCAITLKRLYGYINKYKFNESAYTLMFGVLHLRYFVWVYIFTVSLLAVVGLTLAIIFLSV